MIARTNELREVVSSDARNRAWRTFLQGLGIDVGVAITLILVAAFADIQWTSTYWATLGASLGRTILQTAVSYVFRIFVKPRVAGQGDTGEKVGTDENVGP